MFIHVCVYIYIFIYIMRILVGPSILDFIVEPYACFDTPIQGLRTQVGFIGFWGSRFFGVDGFGMRSPRGFGLSSWAGFIGL